MELVTKNKNLHQFYKPQKAAVINFNNTEPPLAELSKENKTKLLNRAYVETLSKDCSEKPVRWIV